MHSLITRSHLAMTFVSMIYFNLTLVNTNNQNISFSKLPQPFYKLTQYSMLLTFTVTNIQFKKHRASNYLNFT